MNEKSNVYGVLKKIKIEYIVIVFLILFVVYFLISENFSDSSSNQTFVVVDDSVSTEEYSEIIQTKIEKCLSAVSGVGKVKVTVTLDGTVKDIYLTEIERTETSDGSVTQEKVVIIDGKPIVTERVYPKVKGIVVVAEGAENLSVRADIVNAVMACIEIDSIKIQILEMK